METDSARPTARVSRLVYGEDVAAGMQVKQSFPAPGDAGADHPLMALMGGHHRHVDEWVAIAEVRRYGDVCSAIAVREDGSQVGLSFHVGQLLDVAEAL